MKKIIIVLLISFNSILTFGQSSIKGAYLSQTGTHTKLWLFIDGYCSLINYEDEKYISTQGGPFTYSQGLLKINVEYDDANNELIGTTTTIKIKADTGTLIDEEGNQWILQANNDQELDGAWRITGRMQDGRLSEIPKADRKTIKLLVGGYFQWIAINAAEKGFYGTGGGEYKFKNGTYTERILFFSRDNSRIGAELKFNGEIKDGKWNHSGLSSKGDPIFEIWTREHLK